MELEGARVERKQKEEYEARGHNTQPGRVSANLSSPTGPSEEVHAASEPGGHAGRHRIREERNRGARE